MHPSALNTAASGVDDGLAGALLMALARGPEMSAGTLPSVGPASQPSGIASDDWDDLFSAVRMRLEQSIGTHPGRSAPSADNARVHDCVRECVEALGQLHAMLAHERVHRHRLELDIVDLRTALALAITELVETSVPAPLEHATNGATNGA